MTPTLPAAPRRWRRFPTVYSSGPQSHADILSLAACYIDEGDTYPAIAAAANRRRGCEAGGNDHGALALDVLRGVE
ncbi:MAG: hypothetical protein INH13_25770 [Cupriavidus sp.]|nr:hypothetical protein [Cupriavidus sp.]MCA3392432.1 hypothetical protein [Roseomonas sp.]